MTTITPHFCETADGTNIVCLCIRGVDHDEAMFDVPLGDDSDGDA